MSAGRKLKLWDGSKFESLEYSALDSAYTARIYLRMKSEPEFARPEVKRLYDVHSGMARFAQRMFSRGFKVDWVAHGFFMHCLEQEITEKKAKFLSVVNHENMRCSPDALRALLFARHEGWKGIKRFSLPDPQNKKCWTDKGGVSVKEDALLILLSTPECPAEAVPIIDAWWEYAHAVKRASFLNSLKFYDAIGSDDRLRPGWNSCGTDTMRFSCKDPNVMQMEQILRYVLCADEGRTLVHFDKSSFEVQVMAHVSGCEALQKKIDSGNVYNALAREWFNKGPEFEAKKSAPKLYLNCKITHLAKQYWAADNTVFAQALAADRTSKFEQVAALSKKWDQSFQGIIDYWYDEWARVGRNGYSEGRVLGGRRYYARMPDRSEAVNWPVQRTASEMMNLETLEFDERLQDEVPDAFFPAQLHDALDVDCAEGDVEEVTRIGKECLTKEYTFDGRTRAYKVDVKVANSWGDV